jgi:hypothetical protein
MASLGPVSQPRGRIVDMKRARLLFAVAAASICLFLHPMSSRADDETTTNPLRIGRWFSFVCNFDGGYSKTQFFVPHYDTGFFQWDSRAELWLPPYREKFSWGPYVRFSGIAGFKNIQSLDTPGSQSQVFPNAWLSGPGVGIQAYPFSSRRFRGPDSTVGRLLGPLRFFAEYNRTDYWGAKNSWRPHSQTRIGFEYWKAVNVNEPRKYWWLEIWNGLYWQSSNEFTDRYDTVIFANAWRSGLRKPRRGAISTITPYLAVESSRTKYNRMVPEHCAFSLLNSLQPPNPNPNPCNFYWENGLLAGGGLRFAPSLTKLEYHGRAWLNRFVVYGEYLNATIYYGPTAPPTAPRYDVRVGVSASIGQWYK